MKRLIAIIAISAAIAAVSSCEKKQKVAAEQPVVVKGAKIETAQSSLVDDYYEATGTVKSKTTSVLSAKIVGSVIAVHVREGNLVRAGQLLVEIDNRDVKAQTEKAQAGLREAHTSVEEIERSIRASESGKTAAEVSRELAAATFKRYQALLERKSVSQQEFDEVRAKYKVAEAEADRADKMLQSLQARKNQVFARIDQAKADVAGAQVYLSYARINSPINGIVTAKQAEVGSLAMPGAPLLTIEESSSYRLETAVEESRLKDIGLREAVKVTIDALRGDEMPGRVVEIIPTADPASRSYTVKIELPRDQLLRSGLFGKARFITGQKQVITVPQKALVERGQLSGVYIIDGNRIAQMRLVTVGKSYGDRVEILSGLGSGDRIAADSAVIGREGVKVQ